MRASAIWSAKSGSVGNTGLLPGAKTLLVPMNIFSYGLCSGGVYILTEQTIPGMLRQWSPHNLHNLAKWHLKRIVLISRHETWQTVLAR